MTIEAYLNPDFTLAKKLLFLGIAAIVILLCNFLLYGTSGISGEKKNRKDRYESLLLRFYELVISATSVMSFACAYVVCNHVYNLYQGTTSVGPMGTFLDIWGNWKDFALLFLICLSCFINTLIDKVLIPLKGISRDEIAVQRMLGMFYAIIILLYLNVIGDESEYGPVMMYYLGLMVGRFVYFDASFVDFLKAMKNVILNLPMLILGLAVSGSMTFLGFQLGYFLERNYYIMGVFYTHLFLLIAVFIFHHVQRLTLFRKKKAVEYDGGYDDGYDDEYDEEYEYED